MKNKVLLKTFSTILVPILIVGCSSHKKINKLASQLQCNKAIEFTFDESNKDVAIDKRGWNFGNSPAPDYEESFKLSLEDLVQSSNLNLKFNKSDNSTSDSIHQVHVKIDSIIWNFGFSSAIMATFLVYELPEKSVNIVGKNKVYLQGTKKGNLFKSLKHGNYLFLTKFCAE